MTDILQAARSYYGLADIESCTTQLFTNQAGQACVAFEIPLSPEDFIAIGQRMKVMQEAESQQLEQAPVFGEDLDTHAMRQQYDALSKAERGKYGSFGRYLTAMSNGIIEAEDQGVGGRKVTHIDAPEAEEPTTMGVVYMSWDQLNDAQKLYCSYEDPEKGYAVNVAMLTEEQRQKAKEKL